MNWTWGSIQTKIRDFLRIFQKYPGACIVIAIIILILAIFRADDTKSSAGMWTWVIIAIFLFLYGLGGITGVGLGMSF